jgi:hypothetical protein
MTTELDRRRETASDGAQQRETNLSSAEPLFILAPPCTFSWTVCAMLGQHPQMYGLPELHLFSADTVEGWLDIGSQESYQMDHGLARVIANLYFGGQTDHAVARARGWLRRRAHFTTGFLFEVLAERLKPLVLVEKSPSIIYRAEFMERARSMLPGARFLHLVSHPATYCEAVTEALRELSAQHAVAAGHWLMQLTCFPRHPPGEPPEKPVPDPQVSWHTLHKGIANFLETVPAAQRLVVRGEDLLTNSDERLMEVLLWLGLRTDSKAVDEVRHPERSHFAVYGPASAPFGSDIFLVPGPMFRPAWILPRSLEGPLSWRSDGKGFFPEVKELASQFGYE